ncbi:MAG TPA: hypothetical protein VIG99_33255 [Myxococcaceae bacterium]
MRTLFAASLFAAAAIAASGCAPSDLSVFVEEAFLMDDECAKGDTILVKGSLDLGPSVTAGSLPRYIGLFRLRSDLEPIVTQVGDDILAGTSRNEFIATTVTLSYNLASGAGVPAATEPIYFVIPPGATNSTILFNMLNTAAAQAIAGSVPVGSQDTLLVNFQFNGNVRSAGGGLLPLHTPQVSFPITLYQTVPSIPSCSTGVPVLVGPCGNSQEAYTIDCSG